MIVGIVLIVVFLIVLFFGMPISMGMGIGTLASMIAGGYDFSTLPMLIQKGANSYSRFDKRPSSVSTTRKAHRG